MWCPLVRLIWHDSNTAKCPCIDVSLRLCPNVCHICPKGPLQEAINELRLVLGRLEYLGKSYAAR